MRLKSLMTYHVTTIKKAIGIFFVCYMAGTLLGSVFTAIFNSKTVAFGINNSDIGKGWSVSIFAFSIFMAICGLISSQQDTRFLITRSVSRKEIFTSNILFLVPLSAFMSILQIASIYIDSGVQYLLGAPFKGLSADIQLSLAPNMKNVFVFFIVSFSILFIISVISFLLGSLMARWKIQTICICIVAFLLLLALIAIPSIGSKIFNIVKYMFYSDNSGLIIAVKQIIFALLLLPFSMFVIRKVTASK